VQHLSQNVATTAPPRGLAKAIAAHSVARGYQRPAKLTLEHYLVSVGLYARGSVICQCTRTLTTAFPDSERKAHDSASSSQAKQVCFSRSNHPVLHCLIPTQNRLHKVRRDLANRVGCPTSRWWPKPHLVLGKLRARCAALRLSELCLSFPSCTITACSGASATLWQDPVA
jgi:hypothetical protein